MWSDGRGDVTVLAAGEQSRRRSTVKEGHYSHYYCYLLCGHTLSPERRGYCCQQPRHSVQHQCVYSYCACHQRSMAGSPPRLMQRCMSTSTRPTPSPVARTSGSFWFCQRDSARPGGRRRTGQGEWLLHEDGDGRGALLHHAAVAPRNGTAGARTDTGTRPPVAPDGGDGLMDRAAGAKSRLHLCARGQKGPALHAAP